MHTRRLGSLRAPQKLPTAQLQSFSHITGTLLLLGSEVRKQGFGKVFLKQNETDFNFLNDSHGYRKWNQIGQSVLNLDHALVNH